MWIQECVCFWINSTSLTFQKRFCTSIYSSGVCRATFTLIVMNLLLQSTYLKIEVLFLIEAHLTSAFANLKLLAFNACFACLLFLQGLTASASARFEIQYTNQVNVSNAVINWFIANRRRVKGPVTYLRYFFLWTKATWKRRNRIFFHIWSINVYVARWSQNLRKS